MGLVVTNSPDIGFLEVKCVFDLTGALPVINLTNQSTTADADMSPIPSPAQTLAGLVWVLNIYSPTGTPIYQSDFDTPFKTGIWTTAQITNPWPRPFNQIEWSGGDYRVEFQVKDTTGIIYDLFKGAAICRPVGNDKKSTNTFGVVDLSVEVLCDKASLYIKDNTSKTYKGITGTLISGYLAVDYPRDPTGVRPDPFEITSFVTDAMVPFTFNANGYEATYYSIYQYDLGDNCFVLIRYTAQDTFPVQCNIDLCPIACEVASLENKIQTGKCDDIVEAQRKLGLITPKLLRAFIAQRYPLCGMDLPALIEEIKTIGGFDCDCVNGSTGIGAQSTRIDGILFSVNNEGGDVVASFEVTGNNVVLNIKDKSYTFGSCAPIETTAIALKTTTSGTNVNVCLQVSLAALAQDLYTATANNTYLLNLFNSLVIGGGGSGLLLVDGRCVIDNGACNYSFTFQNVATSPANTILKQISSSIPANQQLPNYAFNLSTLVAFQTYLNTLGIGTFIVTNPSGATVLVTSASNHFGLTGMVYVNNVFSIKEAIFTKDCSGFIALTPTQVVQAIINYLCELTDNQLVTYQDYDICYIDPTSKLKVTTTVASGTNENTFIKTLLEKICLTADYLIGVVGMTCDGFKKLFVTKPLLPLQNTDLLFGTKSGTCAGIPPIELFTSLLNLSIYDATAKTAFCNFVALCSGGLACEPYTIFQVVVVDTSPSSNLMSLVITFTHPSAISHTIRYARIDNTSTPIYTTITGVLPGASPKTISGLDDGCYFVGITPIYADGRACAEVSTVTGVCTGIVAFSAVVNGSGNIVASYSASGSLAKVKLVINYPNGGTVSSLHTNTGADITVTPPAGLYGDYIVTLIPVCNSTTGFEGAATGPVILNVTPPANSTFTNNTADNTLAPISMIAERLDVPGTSTSFNVASVGPSGDLINFYLAPGIYGKVEISYPTGTVGVAYLVSSSGVILASVSANSIVFEEEFTNTTGIQIVALDPSP